MKTEMKNTLDVIRRRKVNLKTTLNSKQVNDRNKAIIRQG